MNTYQKVLICGFPHCGTSILKSIIGHIDDVYEILDESAIITHESVKSGKKFILCKWPFTINDFFDKKYKDFIKIFIIRNPLFAFSSLDKRFESNIPNDHNFACYVNTLQKFIKYKNNPEKDIYTIRYEDLFENNYNELKKILNDIGFRYDDSIFDNNKYTNVHLTGVDILDSKPDIVDGTYHSHYRTWQINQPFVLNNDISKIKLNEAQIEEIVNDHYVLQIYPDIKSIITS